MQRTIILLTILAGCSATSAQRQACYAEADAIKISAALTVCEGYEWDDCPEREAIQGRHEEALVQCGK